MMMKKRENQLIHQTTLMKVITLEVVTIDVHLGIVEWQIWHHWQSVHNKTNIKPLKY